jgi:hypothetical protein
VRRIAQQLPQLPTWDRRDYQNVTVSRIIFFHCFFRGQTRFAALLWSGERRHLRVAHDVSHAHTPGKHGRLHQVHSPVKLALIL